MILKTCARFRGTKGLSVSPRLASRYQTNRWSTRNRSSWNAVARSDSGERDRLLCMQSNSLSDNCRGRTTRIPGRAVCPIHRLLCCISYPQSRWTMAVRRGILHLGQWSHERPRRNLGRSERADASTKLQARQLLPFSEAKLGSRKITLQDRSSR